MNKYDIIPAAYPCSEAIKDVIFEKVKLLLLSPDEFPVFIIHAMPTNTVMYMSPAGLEQLGIDLAAVRALGNSYYERFFNYEDAQNYLNQWNLFSKDINNKGNWFTYFQQVHLDEKANFNWFLSISKVLMYDEQQKPLFALTIPLQLNQYLPILPKLERIISENAFIKNNIEKFSLLTKKEKEILRLMALGKTIKEIELNLFISEKTIRTHRRNIKLKLKIKNDVAIVQYAQAFNLI